MNRIFIATHKKNINLELVDYVPIQVGAAINQERYGYLLDNIGENISEKNKNFCELTALYWMWKNNNTNIIGLVHYRRFFFVKLCARGKDVLNSSEISKLMDKYDLVLPQKTVMLKKTVKSNYEEEHNIQDLYICRKVIIEKCPQYLESFDEIMKRHQYYPFNMMITKKYIFDEYMEWLFDILFEAENYINIDNYNEYNKRVYGFLAERLFNVWLLYNIRSLKIKSSDISEIPWFYTGKVNMFKKATSFLGAKFFNKKYEESF